MTENIKWLGHDVFRIAAGSTVIYTDPFRLGETQDKADLILVTHDHFDHFSAEDIAKVWKDDSVIVGPASLAGKTTGALKIVKPGDRIEVKGVPIEVTWAYNVSKFRSPGEPFHPKSPDFVGYILNVEGKRIYLAGDTDLIPEMSGIKVDVALIPVSGTYVMTADEAIEAANTAIEADVCIPMHFNAIVGTEEDARKFAAGVKRGSVKVLPQS